MITFARPHFAAKYPIGISGISKDERQKDDGADQHKPKADIRGRRLRHGDGQCFDR